MGEWVGGMAKPIHQVLSIQVRGLARGNRPMLDDEAGGGEADPLSRMPVYPTRRGSLPKDVDSFSQHESFFPFPIGPVSGTLHPDNLIGINRVGYAPPPLGAFARC
jgi:hypothetical protein